MMGFLKKQTMTSEGKFGLQIILMAAYSITRLSVLISASSTNHPEEPKNRVRE